MLKQEETFVKVAVDKETSIIPTDDLDILKKEVKELQEAQKKVLENPDKPDNWLDKVKNKASGIKDGITGFFSSKK